MSKQPWVTLCLWCLVAVLAVRFLVLAERGLHKPTFNFAAYYLSARLLTEGADPAKFYDQEWFRAQAAPHGIPVREEYGPNPPTTSLLMLPLAWMPHDTARAAWAVLNVGLLVGVLVWVLRRLHLPHHWTPAILILVLLFQPLYANQVRGQAYLVILALQVAAWHGYRAGKPPLLGISVGAMLALKTAGVLLVPLLVVQRQWRALTWMGASLATICIGSLPCIGIDAWQAYAKAVQAQFALPWLGVSVFQTPAGFMKHLFAYEPRFNPSPLVDLPILAVVLGVCLSYGPALITFWLARKRGSNDGLFAACLALGAVLPPSTIEHHFVQLLLPLAILVAAWPPAPKWFRVLTVVAVLFLGTRYLHERPSFGPGLLGFIAYPRVYGVWLVWGLCLWSVLHIKTRGANATNIDGASREAKKESTPSQPARQL